MKRKTTQAAKSSSHQLRKRGHLGRKAPSPGKKKAVSEDQEGCGHTSQQTSPDWFEGEENAQQRTNFRLTKGYNLNTRTHWCNWARRALPCSTQDGCHRWHEWGQMLSRSLILVRCPSLLQACMNRLRFSSHHEHRRELISSCIWHCLSTNIVATLYLCCSASESPLGVGGECQHDIGLAAPPAGLLWSPVPAWRPQPACGKTGGCPVTVVVVFVAPSGLHYKWKLWEDFECNFNRTTIFWCLAIFCSRWGNAGIRVRYNITDFPIDTSWAKQI